MLVTTLLVLLVLGICYWTFIRPYGYWKKNGVPHPKPKLFFGNLFDSITLDRNLGQIYQDIYEKYKDYLYVGFYKFLRPGIVLRDIELVKNVLIKDFPYFHDNDLHINEDFDPLFGKNPFCLHGERWKIVRSSITSAITTGKIKSMLYLMTNVCKDMGDYLNKEVSNTGTLEMEAKELTAKFTTDVVASCAFGLDGNSFKDPNAEFRQMGRKFLMPTFWQGLRHNIIFALPKLAQFLGLKFIPEYVGRWFSKVIQDTIFYRQQNNVVRNDYLDLLISLKSKTWPNKFTDKDVIGQAMTFYVDGFETSSITMAHTLYELAEHPDIQEKLRQEMEEVLAKYNNEITYEAIQEMLYLDNVLNEALRIHSPLHFMGRLCTKRYVLPHPKEIGRENYLTIEPGTPVIIPIRGIHFDPKYYPDPYTFNPDRFTEDNRKDRPKCTFLAFGEGPRICLGMKFGIAQSKAALITIITNFKVTPSSKTLRPLEIDPQYIFTNAKGGIYLNFTKIKK